MRLGLGLAAAALFLIPHAASAEPTETSCRVGEVAVFPDRVHVFCTRDIGFPNMGMNQTSMYFAVEIASPLAAYLVAIASDATVSRRDIAVIFDSDPAFNPPGCLVDDCRRALVVKGFGG